MGSGGVVLGLGCFWGGFVGCVRLAVLSGWWLGWCLGLVT